MHSTSSDDLERDALEEEHQRIDRRLTTVAAVMRILDARDDLRGVNALADHLDYAARWGT